MGQAWGLGRHCGPRKMPPLLGTIGGFWAHTACENGNDIEWALCWPWIPPSPRGKAVSINAPLSPCLVRGQAFQWSQQCPKAVAEQTLIPSPTRMGA